MDNLFSPIGSQAAIALRKIELRDTIPMVRELVDRIVGDREAIINERLGRAVNRLEAVVNRKMRAAYKDCPSSMTKSDPVTLRLSSDNR